jgi:hypothetical protein
MLCVPSKQEILFLFHCHWAPGNNFPGNLILLVEEDDNGQNGCSYNDANPTQYASGLANVKQPEG